MSLLLYIAQVTFCMTCFYGLYYLTLRRETMFVTNRAYLISTLCMSMILPLVKIYIEDHSAAQSVMLAPYEVVSPYVEELSSGIVTQSKANWSWNSLVIGLYVLGVGFMCVRLCKAIFEIFYIRRRGKILVLGGRKCIRSAQVKSPFSFFNTIYLPLQHSFEEEELKEIIVHEWAHIQGRHTIDILLIELACIGLWPSPVIYLYRKALKDVHEFEADAAVLKDTPWDVYANLLLNQQQSHLQNILSNQLMYSQLKNRLRMMNQKRSGAMAGLKYLGFIPVVLIALVLFSFRERSVISNASEGSSERMAESYPALTEGTTILDEIKQVTKQFLPVGSPQLPGKDRKNPVFPSCATVDVEDQEACTSKAMMQYVQDHLKYPESLKSAGLEGMVVVKFTIGSDGWMKDISVARSLHPDADQMVLDIMGQMNKDFGQWLPATQDGQGHDAEMYLPVKFTLTGAAQDEEVLQYAEEMPRFPGCEQFSDSDERSKCVINKLYEFVYSTIQYPEVDKNSRVEGTCVAQFTIKEDGSISDIKVLRAPSDGMREEVMRMMKLMSELPDKWIPGRHEGKPVAVRYTLPVKFVIKDESQPEVAKDINQTRSGMDQNTLKIVPNPATEEIKVEVPENTSSIQVYNSSGQGVFSLKVSDQNKHDEIIPTASWPTGNYVVQVVTPTGNYSGSLSIVR